jgi:hypothetical protein
VGRASCNSISSRHFWNDERKNPVREVRAPSLPPGCRGQCFEHFDQTASIHDTTSASTDVHNFLIGEVLDIHVLFGMFNSHTDELPISIEFDENILVDVSCLGNFFMSEIY